MAVEFKPRRKAAGNIEGKVLLPGAVNTHRAGGFAAGIFAGAIGALGYSLACPEASMAFVAVWYTLGIALTGAAGALVGPWALRW